MIDYIRSIECGIQLEIVKNDGMERLANKRAVSFLNDWCMLFGSTYEGRRKACAKAMGIQQKIPILISETTKDIMFPTRDVRSFECVWVNYRSVDIVKGTINLSKILFLDGTVCKIACDIRMLKREIAICQEYLQILASSSYLFHAIIQTSEE